MIECSSRNLQPLSRLILSSGNSVFAQFAPQAFGASNISTFPPFVPDVFAGNKRRKHCEKMLAVVTGLNLKCAIGNTFHKSPEGNLAEIA